MADPDNIILTAEVEFFSADQISTGKEGHYYRISETDDWTGPVETQELAVAAVMDLLQKSADDFVKQILNLPLERT